MRSLRPIIFPPPGVSWTSYADSDDSPLVLFSSFWLLQHQPEMRCLYFVTDAFKCLITQPGVKMRGFNSDWSDSEHIHVVNDPHKATLSVRLAACFICTVITRIVPVPWQTRALTVYSPWRKQTTMHASDKQWTLNPSSLFVLFAIINWTWETRQTRYFYRS